MTRWACFPPSPTRGWQHNLPNLHQSRKESDMSLSSLTTLRRTSVGRMSAHPSVRSSVLVLNLTSIGSELLPRRRRQSEHQAAHSCPQRCALFRSKVDWTSECQNIPSSNTFASMGRKTTAMQQSGQARFTSAHCTYLASVCPDLDDIFTAALNARDGMKKRNGRRRR